MQNYNVLPSDCAIRAAFGNLTPPTNLNVALDLAPDGTPVYPASPYTKAPLVPGGYKAATTDRDTIIGWFARWPCALTAIATGPASGFFVLDVDGPAGLKALQQLLIRLSLEQIADLTSIVVRTPGGGLHLYFTLRPGETPRSRARDIGDGLDTRCIGGGIIAPGNVLPDGRSYRLVEAADLSRPSTYSLHDASYAPLELVYLATFSARERALIAGTAGLREMICAAGSHKWADVMKRWRDAEAAKLRQHVGPFPDKKGYRAQALSDLQRAACTYASLSDGRRSRLYNIACGVTKYFHHGYLSEQEIRSAFLDAARANGALGKYGLVWADATLRSAFSRARNDALPRLAREFRANGGR
jgi:hypothetical protein